jgi:hypothetical protein
MSRVADISSPHHANGSGRVTPRGSTAHTWQGAYSTPQRSNTAPTTIYNVVEPRDGPNGAPDSYYQSASYANGGLSNKRGREEDDAEDDVKRTKTEHDDGGPVGGSSPYTAVNGPRGSISRGKAR